MDLKQRSNTHVIETAKEKKREVLFEEKKADNFTKMNKRHQVTASIISTNHKQWKPHLGMQALHNYWK